MEDSILGGDATRGLVQELMKQINCDYTGETTEDVTVEVTFRLAGQGHQSFISQAVPLERQRKVALQISSGR
jgi:hypothetical protein